ncbi:hypothetical protein [Microbacterium sp.]|uniref:hypothetical protein n=1 Tax=Microbacterium sp. TaxID=51671 RepID=UPI003F71443C
MDRINYAGDSFLTGSLIARALLDYAQALAEAGSAGTIEIPTIGADGVHGMTVMLVGPSSQLTATSVATDVAEVEDAALIAKLASLSDELRRTTIPTAAPHAGDQPPAGSFSEFGI